jgi:hypothetical protein
MSKHTVFSLYFGREIDFGKIDGWYTGSVDAHIKRLNEQFPKNSPLGKVFEEDTVAEMFCRLWVGLPLSNENSRLIFFCLDIVVDGEVVASDEENINQSQWGWIEHHKAVISLEDVIVDVDDESEDFADLYYRFYEVMIRSIINEVLDRFDAEIAIGFEKTAQACISEIGGDIFLQTAEVTF